MESEKLIEEMREFPVLYDQSDEKYRNAEYKERVWKIISQTLKAPGGPEECRKRWASIRDQFRRTLQKRKTKSEQAAAKKQKYKYEDILEFLLPHIVERETFSNVPLMDSEFDPRLEDPENDHENEFSSQNEDLEYPDNSSQTTVQPTSTVPPAESTQAIPKKNNRPLNVKRRGYNHEKPIQESPSSQLMAFILAEKEAEKNTVNSANLQHPVDIFLAGLAPTLKSLDPILLNKAKTVIFTTIQDFELQQITKNEQQQATNPHFYMKNHAFFSGVTGSDSSSQSSHSTFTNSISKSPKCNSLNESHQQVTTPLCYNRINQDSFFTL